MSQGHDLQTGYVRPGIGNVLEEGSQLDWVVVHPHAVAPASQRLQYFAVPGEDLEVRHGGEAGVYDGFEVVQPVEVLLRHPRCMGIAPPGETRPLRADPLVQG